MKSKDAVFFLLVLGSWACEPGPAADDPSIETSEAPLLNAPTMLRAVSPNEVWNIGKGTYAAGTSKTMGTLRQTVPFLTSWVTLPVVDIVGNYIVNFQVLDAPTKNVLTLSATNDLWYFYQDEVNTQQSWWVDGNVKQFQWSGATDGVVYVLGMDGNLWAETRTMAQRCLVDSSVQAFQVANSPSGVDPQLFVLGNDGKLWLEQYGGGGSGTNCRTPPPPRWLIASGVRDFEAQVAYPRNESQPTCYFVYFSDSTPYLHRFNCAAGTVTKNLTGNFTKFRVGGGTTLSDSKVYTLHKSQGKTTYTLKDVYGGFDVDTNVMDFSYAGYSSPNHILFVWDSSNRLWKVFGKASNTKYPRQSVGTRD